MEKQDLYDSKQGYWRVLLERQLYKQAVKEEKEEQKSQMMTAK